MKKKNPQKMGKNNPTGANFSMIATTPAMRQKSIRKFSEKYIQSFSRMVKDTEKQTNTHTKKQTYLID